MEKIWIKRIIRDRHTCRCCHYWPATDFWSFNDEDDIPLCAKCAEMELDIQHDMIGQTIVTPHKEVAH